MIEYRCDHCEQIASAGEMLGVTNSVFSYSWGKLTVYVGLALNEETEDRHFCLACMWRALDAMMDERGPDDIKLNLDTGIYPGVREVHPEEGVQESRTIDDTITGWWLDRLNIWGNRRSTRTHRRP